MTTNTQVHMCDEADARPEVLREGLTNNKHPYLTLRFGPLSVFVTPEQAAALRNALPEAA